MIRISFLSLALGIAIHLNSYAQPAPEIQKIEFSNVVIADSLSGELLFQNAAKYVASLKGNDEKFELKLKDSIDGKLYGQCTYFVYSQSGILKKIAGTINYQLAIEVKDNKYRYQFTNYVFNYYKQDRYYNMVATGKTKPLEEPGAQGWQKLWNNHRAYTREKMTNNIKRLAEMMAEDPKKIEKAVPKKVEW